MLLPQPLEMAAEGADSISFAPQKSPAVPVRVRAGGGSAAAARGQHSRNTGTRSGQLGGLEQPDAVMVAQHAAGRADNLRGSWIDQSTFAPFRPWQAFPMLSGDGCSHHLRTFGSALDRSGLDVEQVQSSVSCVINYIFT